MGVVRNHRVPNSMPDADQKHINRVIERGVQNYRHQRAASRPQEEPGEYHRQGESVDQKVDPFTGG